MPHVEFLTIEVPTACRSSKRHFEKSDSQDIVPALPTFSGARPRRPGRHHSLLFVARLLPKVPDPRVCGSFCFVTAMFFGTAFGGVFFVKKQEPSPL